MCQLFLNDYGFDCRLDLEVWKLHSHGLSPREISPCLKTLGLKAKKDTVYKIIDRLERLMKSGMFFEN